MVAATVKKLGHALGRAYIRKITESEAEAQSFKFHTERPIELRFVFDAVTRLRPRTVLDVGSGMTALPAALSDCGCVVTAIDNVSDYWPAGMVNRHWAVVDDDIRRPTTEGTYDLVTCVSVLEHIDRPADALTSMARLLGRGGRIALTTPYNERRHVDDVYALPGATLYGDRPPYICRSTNRADLDEWLAAARLTIERQEFWRVWEGEVWRQGKMAEAFDSVGADDPHQLTCLMLARSE